MEQKEFLEMIRACRKRLNLAGFLQKMVLGMGIGAVAGILFQVISLITPLYYANVYMGIALLLAGLSAAVVAYIKRSTMARTALVMDGFGFQERVITAYENLQAEGSMYALQRADAIRQLKAHKDRIRIPLMPSRKSVLLTAGLLVVMVALVFVPSSVREQAKALHAIRQEAAQKQEEIEAVLEEMEQLNQQDLTAEQQADLQEMMSSLQSSVEEYQQASSAEALQAAGQKLTYKYENMSEQLGGLAQSLENGGASPMTAEAMQAMADKLQQMSGSQGTSQMASGQNGQNGGGQSGNQSGQNGHTGSGQGGQSGDGQNGQGGDGQGGQGGQNGNGENGSGSGGDANNGSGNGTGNGRGTGSANVERDYVSVPNAIADTGNLNGSASDHDNSDYFIAPNGLSWEGTHVSHEAVIGSYEQNAYEGIAAGQYPSGMEDVIKEYFASFN